MDTNSNSWLPGAPPRDPEKASAASNHHEEHSSQYTTPTTSAASSLHSSVSAVPGLATSSGDFSFSLVGLDEEDHHHKTEHYPLLPNERLVPTVRDSPPSKHKYRIVTPEFRRNRYEQRKQVFSCCLAALSAFADVLCHRSFGCYGNMMTGNTIRLMDHVSTGRWDLAAYPAALVPSYILGAALCTGLNKLDLTVLGLGGPSQQAFAHLNPPRRLRSPQQISILRVVAIASASLFLLGELLAWMHGCYGTHSPSCSPSIQFVIPKADDPSANDFRRWRLPVFACAFGLINAATLAAIHIVTNAVTGHWIAVGLGVADDLPVLLNRQSSNPNISDRSNDTEGTIQSKAPKKGWKTSVSVTVSFIGSIVLTSILYNECLRQLKHHPDWLLAILYRNAPPMGILFALLYTSLLYWYTLPPDFLDGYSSQVDLTWND